MFCSKGELSLDPVGQQTAVHWSGFRLKFELCWKSQQSTFARFDLDICTAWSSGLSGDICSESRVGQLSSWSIFFHTCWGVVVPMKRQNTQLVLILTILNQDLSFLVSGNLKLCLQPFRVEAWLEHTHAHVYLHTLPHAYMNTHTIYTHTYWVTQSHTYTHYLTHSHECSVNQTLLFPKECQSQIHFCHNLWWYCQCVG